MYCFNKGCYGGNFLLVRRVPAALFRSSGVFHRKLHGDDQSSQCAVSVLYRFLCPLLIGQRVIQIFGCIHRGGSFIRCRRCNFQRSGQIRVVFFSLPSLACQSPGVHSAEDAFPVQCRDGIHKSLGLLVLRGATF